LSKRHIVVMKSSGLLSPSFSGLVSRRLSFR